MTRAITGRMDRTTFGRDLLLSTTGVPRGHWFEHLCDQLREAIRSGSLQAGVRLPSTRDLARDLGVSRGVPVSVYEQLVAEGYLDSRQGSGTTVAQIAGEGAGTSPASPERRQSPIHHNPGLPDMSLFPRRAWLRSYRAALMDLADPHLSYGHPQGFEPLRSELAGYLGRVRGVRATADDIVIVNGLAQGFALLARILPRMGIEAIAVEEPGSTGARDQLAEWGMDTPPVAVDEQGLVVDELERSGASAVLVTPAHHYPTGVVLSPERRRSLLEWARSADGRYIIEDDYDAEFRYDHAPVGSIQPFDPERVITGSSISKTLSPALRLGWLVLPPALVEAAVRVKAAFDLGSQVLNQAAFAQFLRAGEFDRHLRHSRIRYRRRRAEIASQLEAADPALHVTGLDAGLSLCIHVDLADDRALARELQAVGLRCEALSFYQQAEMPRTGLVLDMVATSDEHLGTAIVAVQRARRS